MKTLAIAAVVFASLATPALCQVAVIDATSNLQQVKSFLQDIKGYALQAQQYGQQAQQTIQLVTQTNALIQHPSLGAAAGLMGTTGLSNDLPVNPYSLVSLTSGSAMSIGGITGRLSALSSMSNNSYGENHVYDCTDNSWACTQQRQRGYGIAGQSGIAQAAYQNFRDHMPVVQALRERAASAMTPAERENVQIALQSEQAWHNNLAGQIDAASMQARADEAGLAQRDNEKMSQDIDASIARIPGG